MTLDNALAWELACGGPFPNPASTTGDEHFMAQAIRQAMNGVGLSNPNPPVGCVLVKDGHLAGQGVHTRAGDPHGEIMALRDAERREVDVRGATAYVTLEPCCYQGRTPPCTEALARAGVARVVVGVRDPNPRVDGGGLALLRAQGVEVTEGVLGEACSRLHAPFFKLIRTGLPWVVLKLALGAEGSLGPEGQHTQVTSPEVQRWGHALRRACGAILAGRGTVDIDDPLLTDRFPAPAAPHRVFLRVVLDTQGRLSASRRVWQPVGGQPAVRVTLSSSPGLRDVEDLRLPPGPGGCSLRHLLHELGARGIDRLLVEGGRELARAFDREDLLDEFHAFRTDRPVGGTPLLLNLAGLAPVRAAVTFPGGAWEIRSRNPWHAL